jgi:hypothetical protein
MSSKKSTNETSRKQLGIILEPKNLLKTVASQFPFASAGTEILNQIEGQKVDARLNVLEGSDAELVAKFAKLEQLTTKTPPVHWPTAVAEYKRRIVEFAVVYDGGFHSRAHRGEELIQPVAHGCFVGANEVLTCSEALKLAQGVAREKYGRVIIVSSLIRYEFDVESPDEFSGLITCRITGKDDKSQLKLDKVWEKAGINRLYEPIQSSIKFSLYSWVGQEIGFIHSGEAKDAMTLDSFSPLQFDTAVISHIKKSRGKVFKSFVTNVLPGRVERAGSPVFQSDGTLHGIIADTESYPSDAGRRAVVKSLIGHPRFMKKEKE